MLQPVTDKQEFKTVHFCGGIGGCSLGMQQSSHEYRGVQGSFRTLFSVDVDPGACEAYQGITGSKAVCADMFSREQYIQFHGTKPPEDWQEITAEDLKAWGNGEYPDVIFISAPCKGFSRLLPKAAASAPKYQALNRLAIRALYLAMEAWGNNPPAVILFENVPGIETRGIKVLSEIRTLLGMYGYVFHEGHHDCGEIGQLGQRRIRYLMIARQPKKLPSFIYQPPRFKHRTIGDVLGPLPMPGDTERGGKMHRIPKLAWRTWERLALIPAGKDWRALRDLNHTPQNGTFRIVPWDRTANTVTAEATMPKNASSISVADPRTPHYNNILKVCDWNEPGASITGGGGVMSGGLSVADPRTAWSRYKVVKWDNPSPAVVGQSNVKGSAVSVADPRISEKWTGAGPYGVTPWDVPANTVNGSASVHNSVAAVADPRIPNADERGVWIIVALDGTWHRPITTYEMAMLQGMPTHLNGKPFELPGNSDAKWREWIGNMVPVQAGAAIGNALLRTMLTNFAGEWHWDVDGNDLWVREKRPIERRRGLRCSN